MLSAKWSLADIRQDKPVKVFTVFSCGGGSSMGYKRAGFEVVGNCEIDSRMNAVYVANNHPKYNYNMDARDFLKEELPQELQDIDILDGSPPCSSFSTCGSREKGWGKEKVFREGQKKQTLDDLFFVYLDILEKMRPKVAVAENVTGLLMGNAKGYVNAILERYRELGYAVQVFRLNSAFMEVPQRRERVFFIANRMGYPKLELEFHYPPIRFGEVRSAAGGRQVAESRTIYRLVQSMRHSDRCLADVNVRLGGKQKYFNQTIVWDDDVAPTMTATTIPLRGCDRTFFTMDDMKAVQTFPQDYNFVKETDANAQYICGMSVPPNMMAHIALEIWNQWLNR